MIALPKLQECSTEMCDTGSSLEDLQHTYGEYVYFPEDLFRSRHIPGGCVRCPRPWFMKEEPKWDDEVDVLRKRASWARRLIDKVRDREIIVVAHGDFNKFLVNQWSADGEEDREIDWRYYGRGEGRPVVVVAKEGVNKEEHHEAGSEKDVETMMRFELPPWYKGDKTEFESWHNPDTIESSFALPHLSPYSGKYL